MPRKQGQLNCKNSSNLGERVKCEEGQYKNCYQKKPKQIIKLKNCFILWRCIIKRWHNVSIPFGAFFWLLLILCILISCPLLLDYPLLLLPELLAKTWQGSDNNVHIHKNQQYKCVAVYCLVEFILWESPAFTSLTSRRHTRKGQNIKALRG